MTSDVSVVTAGFIRSPQPDRAGDAWEETVQQGRALLARKARSFHLATSLLPIGLRDDIAILYAFCRTADDLADEAANPGQARGALSRLDLELAGKRRPGKLVAALSMVSERHDFSLDYARLLLEGVRTDLEVVRIRDDSQLLGYCYRVASTVGLMLCRVLGVRDPAAEPFAVDLGLAMQLTNIVRDVHEDASRNRVYLPNSRLQARGLTAGQLCAERADRELVRQVCLELLELADRHYLSAEQGLSYIPLRARLGIAVAHRVYASIGWRSRRLKHNPLDGRMVVPRYEKAWRIAEAIGVTCRSLGQNVRLHDSTLHTLLHVAPDLARVTL
jgi:phytoene synthase